MLSLQQQLKIFPKALFHNTLSVLYSDEDRFHISHLDSCGSVFVNTFVYPILFFSRPQSDGWPHHGHTFSIYPCPLSFWLTLPRRVLSKSLCCPSKPCVAFLACVHLALFLALSLSPCNSLVSSWCDRSMLAFLLWQCLIVPSLLQLCCEPTRLSVTSISVHVINPLLLVCMCDQLYMMAEGQCIYHGNIPGLVPFLNSQGLVCPPYHNPADYGSWLVYHVFACCWIAESASNQGCSPNKEVGGRLKQDLDKDFLICLGLHTRILIPVRKITTADLWSCPAIQLLMFECL